jgi:Ca2+-binding RTX toxin-like protein
MSRRLGALAGLTVLVAALLPVGGASADTGVTLDSHNAFIDYFLALDSQITAFDDREASDFEIFNEELSRTLSRPAARATATVRQSASIQKGTDDTLEGAVARASMSGSAPKSSDDDFVTVSSPTAAFSMSFSVPAEVHYSLTASPSASNNDSDDCSLSEISFEGPSVSLYRRAFAGGDCGVFDPNAGSTSGVLAPGEYSLSAEAEVSVAGEDASASGASGYGISLDIIPPCDVTGTPADDPALNGTPGNDVICGLGGNDTIDGGLGNDIIVGGDGNDIVTGAAGLDEMFGGAGNDDLGGGPGTDLIYGEDGDDEISGDDGSDTSISNPPNGGLFGGPGEDSINGGSGNDRLDGDDDIDILKGGAGIDRLDGGLAVDDLFGGDENDKLMGGAANDVLRGEGGNDELLGGTQNDVLRAGPGSDRARGEDGNDKVAGEGGDDSVSGGSGDDELNGGGGPDDMAGDAGDDTFLAKDGTRDELRGGPGRDRARKDRIDIVNAIEVFF